MVFADIQVKFDGVNMFEWSSLIVLTQVSRELGDPRYKTGKA